MAKVKKLPSLSEIVDNLGRTKAEIAMLEVTENKYVTALKDRGVGEYCGSLFQAQIFTQERGKAVNWQAIAKKLKAKDDLVAKHTKTEVVVTVDWEAIAKELKPGEEIVKEYTTVAQEVTVCKVTARK